VLAQSAGGPANRSAIRLIKLHPDLSSQLPQEFSIHAGLPDEHQIQISVRGGKAAEHGGIAAFFVQVKFLKMPKVVCVEEGALDFTERAALKHGMTSSRYAEQAGEKKSA
jgi:hypothetical protein